MGEYQEEHTVSKILGSPPGILVIMIKKTQLFLIGLKES